MKRALLWLVFCMSLVAQASDVLDLLGRTVKYSEIAISPDGKLVAWVEGRPGSASVRIVAAAGGSPRAVSLDHTAGRTDSEPAWSPKDHRLAFFSDHSGANQKQLYIVGEDGSGAKPHTTLKGYAGRPKWSHDGKKVAFLYIEGAGGGGPLMAAPAQTGVIDTAFVNQRIAVLDVDSGTMRQASPGDLHVYDFDWSPDDRMFVTTSAPGPGDANWWIAQIRTIDIAAGSAKVLYKPKLQVALPRWSPDGKNVGFIEGIMSDEGFHGGDLFTIPVSGGTPVNRTPKRRTSPSSFAWVGPDRIQLTEWSGGNTSISELSLKNGEIKTLWNGREALWADGNFPSLAFTPDGSAVAAIRSSFDTAPEVWAGPPGNWKKLTSGNADIKAAWGKVENVEWISDDLRVQGWLMHPMSEQSGQKYPMVVLIHGGPSNIERPSWPSFTAFAQILSGGGHFVFMPNSRGSYGQGEAFTQANIKDFGHGDLRDIMKGVDTILAKYPVDENRLGVTGWSYGGYMTMWTVTQTNRFKAAMAGAGIANWQSYYGQNLIDTWMPPFFGATVYDDPAIYRRSSPIEYIKNVKTPTLVIVGERDAECPAPQSYEFWHALRALGVKTQLVVYPGEGHLFMDPKNRRDLHERLLAWFRDNLK